MSKTTRVITIFDLLWQHYDKLVTSYHTHFWYGNDIVITSLDKYLFIILFIYNFILLFLIFLFIYFS